MGDRQNIGKNAAGGKRLLKLCIVPSLLLGAMLLAYFWWFDRVKAGELPETKHLLVPKKVSNGEPRCKGVKEVKIEGEKFIMDLLSKPVLYLYMQ